MPGMGGMGGPGGPGGGMDMASLMAQMGGGGAGGPGGMDMASMMQGMGGMGEYCHVLPPQLVIIVQTAQLNVAPAN